MNRRKIIPIFIACVVSLGLILFAVTKDKWIFAAKNTKNEVENTQAAGLRVVVEKALKDSAEKDSDGDGIKDWEEDFQKNSAASDTNSETNGKNAATNGTGVADNSPKTKTDEISRNLFAEYMQLKQSGNLNQNTIANLVTKAVSSIDTGEIKFFTSADFKTIPDTDTNGARNYLNALVTIREKYKNLYIENQIITVGGSIDFNDPATVQSIKTAAGFYTSMTGELKALLVPKSLVAAQVALLNNYSTSADGLTSLSEIKTDPIRAMAGIQKHTNAASQEPEILLSVSQFFSNRGIVFSSYEPGSRINSI